MPTFLLTLDNRWIVASMSLDSRSQVRICHCSCLLALAAGLGGLRVVGGGKRWRQSSSVSRVGPSVWRMARSSAFRRLAVPGSSRSASGDEAPGAVEEAYAVSEGDAAVFELLVDGEEDLHPLERGPAGPAERGCPRRMGLWCPIACRELRQLSPDLRGRGTSVKAMKRSLGTSSLPRSCQYSFFRKSTEP